MNRQFILKVISIFFLAMLMAWAVMYINSIISSRSYLQNNVKESIARSSAGAQTVLGPLLVIAYTEEYTTKTVEDKVEKITRMRDDNTMLVLPQSLTLDGGFITQNKKLGIYEARMYQLNGQIKGNFEIPDKIQPQHKDGVITIKSAKLSFGISDTRGFTSKPVLNWDNRAVEFKQGSDVNAIGAGIHAELGDLANALGKNIPFDFELGLRGMENFAFSPVADINTINLRSNWPHPHFNGDFLPDSSTQKVSKDGFVANWNISSIASNNQTELFNRLTASDSNTTVLKTLDVGFIEPVNIYSLADRATKYGLLFIGLTFAGFFMVEVIKRLSIHPAQYTLVGLAMALFYLLLISFAEHIGFAYAYLLASVACVSLLGYYLSYVLKSKTSGITFAALLTLLYGALYGILQSEDNALLMGSVLVFILLALTMIITRNINWYEISAKN